MGTGQNCAVLCSFGLIIRRPEGSATATPVESSRYYRVGLCVVKSSKYPVQIKSLQCSGGPPPAESEDRKSTPGRSDDAIRWREASKAIHGSRPRLSLQLECRTPAAVRDREVSLWRPKQSGRGETPAHPTIPISQKLKMKGDKTIRRREMTITKMMKVRTVVSALVH